MDMIVQLSSKKIQGFRHEQTSAHIRHKILPSWTRLGNIVHENADLYFHKVLKLAYKIVITIFELMEIVHHSHIMNS
jgi:hypothetical protein